MQKSHLETYRLLMSELKERIGAIDAVLKNTNMLWPVAGYELCHLQLRQICELIALGCLAAHGDISGTRSKRLLQSFEPGKIFAELKKLHPDFFPRACGKSIEFKDGVACVSVLEDESFPSKHDLIALHGKTGNILHRGNIKKIGKPFNLDFSEVENWRNKIVNMLALHMIATQDPMKYVLVMMQDPATGNVSTSEISVDHMSEGWSNAERRRRSGAT